MHLNFVRVHVYFCVLNRLGFDYLGASMTITIYEDQLVEVEVHSVGDYPLVLQRNSTTGGKESLDEGFPNDVMMLKIAQFWILTLVCDCRSFCGGERRTQRLLHLHVTWRIVRAST